MTNENDSEEAMAWKKLPVEDLIGQLLQDHALLTYQLTTAIAAKLLVHNETKGGIKTVEDFLKEVQGENEDETTEV